MTNRSYFNSQDKHFCCGCRACENVCSFEAIKMEYDSEGFLYPVIEKSNCHKCGQCIKTCPVINRPLSNTPESVYALQYQDCCSLKNSSSGGVFIGIAKYIQSIGGSVFGCILDENNKAIIVEADSEEMLHKMQGSKYVSSDTGNSYSQVKQLLDDGTMVFYSGAPCQVAGLRNFLKKDYENLLTMDFLCHGMPAEKIFQANLRYLENQYGGEISDYKFRDKSLKGWGHVSSFKINEKRYYEAGTLNGYFSGFINGLLNRYSCYSCAFRGLERISDITVGDFWGYSGSKINSEQGVSFLTVNTEAGRRIYNHAIVGHYLIQESSTTDVGEMNSSLVSNETEPVPEIRKKIYLELDHDGYEKIRKKYFIPKKYWLIKLSNHIPTTIKKGLISLYRRLK